MDKQDTQMVLGWQLAVFQSTSSGARPTADITDNTLIFPWDSSTGNDYLLLDNEGGDWTLFQNILYSSQQ